jgi:NAD(P)-dependent dehydrogenase (short-subunit alcohol dehydrogenase family)
MVCGMMPLGGQVAVVAGATRGAGRGIARALGEAGAAVYCTGRSTLDNPSPYKRPETIEETAEMIATAGGRSLAIRVDHTLESEVQALFERVDKEHGRLDVLVNSVAGEDPMMRQWGSFWNTHLENGEAIFHHHLETRSAADDSRGPRSHRRGERKRHTVCWRQPADADR